MNGTVTDLMKPDKATRAMFNRDAEIARLYRDGVQRRELAERFRLSTAGIHQAIRKAGEEAQQARDSDAFVREFARFGQMDRLWPCEKLLFVYNSTAINPRSSSSASPPASACRR